MLLRTDIKGRIVGHFATSGIELDVMLEMSE